MLYSAPSGAVQFIFIWLGILGVHFLPRNRALVIILLTIVPLVGNVLLLILDTSAGWGLIVASWLVRRSSLWMIHRQFTKSMQASSISCIMTIILSLSASNIKGIPKRSVVNTLFFIGYCVGAIAGPQVWTEPPRYTKGVITAIVLWVVFAILIGVYWILCYYDNRSRDRSTRENTMPSNDQAPQDMTDRQDKRFRYSY